MTDPVDLATRAVEALGAAFLSGQSTAVLPLFADSGDIVYAGSEPGEIAVGTVALTALLEELFAREERYSWRASSVAAVAGSGHLYVVADCDLAVHPVGPGRSVGAATQTVPYRVSGVLESQGAAWRWRLCQGSEPASPVP